MTPSQRAEVFMKAWAERKWLELADYPPEPASVAEMYETHLAMQCHALADSHFGGLAGYKLGGIGLLGEPMLYAPLFRRFVVEAFLGSVGSVSSSAMQMHTLEVEIGVIMGSDLPPRPGDAPYTDEEVWAAVESVAPCIECCGRRSTAEVCAGLSVLGKNADCLMAGGIVVGRRFSASDVSPTDLCGDCATSLAVNGEEAARGTGAECPLGGPLPALAWLANHLNSRGLALLKGQVVITGFTCKSPAFKVGDRITANVGRLASVAMTVDP